MQNARLLLRRLHDAFALRSRARAPLGLRLQMDKPSWVQADALHDARTAGGLPAARGRVDGVAAVPLRLALRPWREPNGDFGKKNAEVVAPLL